MDIDFVSLVGELSDKQFEELKKAVTDEEEVRLLQKFLPVVDQYEDAVASGAFGEQTRILESLQICGFPRYDLITEALARGRKRYADANGLIGESRSAITGWK